PVPVVDELGQRARPGGAALAAALAAADGHEVALVTALGDDAAGRELRLLIEASGVELIDLGLSGATPEKVRVLAEGRLLLRVDRGGNDAVPGSLSERASAILARAAAILVSDYGRGIVAGRRVRDELAALAGRVPLVWDPHRAGAEPVRGGRLATPNRSEAAAFLAGCEEGVRAVAARAQVLRERWDASAVAVTLGADGAVLVEHGTSPLLVPATPVIGGDVCGAGDRFAATAAALLGDGASTREAVEAAVDAASAFVAAGGAGAVALPRRPAEPAGDRPDNGHGRRRERAEDVIARARGRNGVVVATGGCFDLLHAGHVAMLESARALGDCLVVCVNSDESVRRLKGADRPLVPEEDRVAVLQALAAVDAVVVFDEDTPEAVLDHLRPDLFAKGGDYTVDELPEARLLETWGGRAVILPYVPGRSTTRLIEEAQILGAR
ncbi:MAG: D-glycero-beta-D-manno-heptose 1-phosphate adenylyltransferase, partial [Actinomycetota bacterium]|nr:D-glycero-beta-D-manno-heptose 1-phosphate adenylyltransferase [Actinomycetota bacterium]